MMNLQQTRIIRLAVGTTVGFILAITVNWSIAFITPVLLAKFLGSTSKPISLTGGGKAILLFALAFLPSYLLGFITRIWPDISILLLALGYFTIFYLGALEKIPSILATMLLLGITILPLMAIINMQLVSAFIVDFLFSASIAVLVASICFALLPDPEGTSYAESRITEKPLQTQQQSQLQALASTLVVLPIALYFYGTGNLDDVLILAFTAILMQTPNLGSSVKSSLALVFGNFLGGLIAYIIFILITIAPSLGFFTALVFLCSLLVGKHIFSEHKFAPLFAMGLSTALLLLASITGSAGGDFSDKFFTRMAQILCASIYITFSLLVLKGLFASNKQGTATIEQ